MTPEEIAAMQKELADLKAAKITADKTIAEKDAVIARKTDDIVRIKAGSVPKAEYKLLKDMTDAERSAMSDKEIELQQRHEQHEADVAAWKKEQADSLAKERGARIDSAVKRLAGTDEALAGKIKDGMGRIKDFDAAQIDEEIQRVAQDSYAMLGSPRPTGVGAGTGGEGGLSADQAGGSKNDYSDTEAGKALAAAMGLATPPPPAAK